MTNATHIRNVTVDMPDFTSSDTVKFTLNSYVSIADNLEIFPGKTYTLTLDGSGMGNIDLPTPDGDGSASWAWIVTLPDGNMQDITLAWASGAVSLATLLAAESSTTTANDLTALLASRALKNKTIVNKTDDYTTVDGDDGKIIQCSKLAGMTVTLHTPTQDGFSLRIVNIGIGDVTVAASGSDTLNSLGSSNVVSAKDQAFVYYSLSDTLWSMGGIPATVNSVTVSSINGYTGGGHAHAITSSSNPGAAASIMATNATGDFTFGGELGMADNLITRPVLQDYGETVNAIGSIGGGTQDIDLESGNVVSGTVDTSTTTFTFSNPPASGTAGSFKLFLTNGGSQTVNWPASVNWAGGTTPTLTNSGVDILTFTTIDGGITWYGRIIGLNFS